MFIAWVNGRSNVLQSIGASFAEGGTLKECEDKISDKMPSILKIQLMRLGEGDSVVTITKGKNQKKIIKKYIFPRMS